jgi:hypothetical protein
MDKADIIARRELEQDGRKYEVLIEMPQRNSTGDFTCAWSLVDDSGTVITSQAMFGVDSAQSLLMTLLVIGDCVAAESTRFTHFGMEGTGFPRHLETDRSDISAWFVPRGKP